MEERKYTEHELEQKIERAKKSIEFRVDVDKRLDRIEDALEKLLAQKDLCQCAWRKDILWFCGVPATCLGVIFAFIRLMN
jgi:hypothetical protein